MMKYKGYFGSAQIDVEAGVIRGTVIDVQDTITFQGASVKAAQKAFEESVDDYLEFCRSLGRTPEKPFSGKMLVRVTPDLHRKLSLAAQIKGVSVNRLVVGQLRRLIRAVPGKVSRPTSVPSQAAAPAKASKAATAKSPKAKAT